VGQVKVIGHFPFVISHFGQLIEGDRVKSIAQANGKCEMINGK